MDERNLAEAEGTPVDAGVPEPIGDDDDGAAAADPADDGGAGPANDGAAESLAAIDAGTGGAGEADDEQNLRRDLEELSARAGRADEYLELAQRTQADFENYRKRAARDAAAAQDRGVAKLAKELLPAIDNLDRALAAAETVSAGEEPQVAADSQLASGIRLVHDEVLAALARLGIEPFAPTGEAFDPQYHEAVAQAPVDGAPAGTVVEVYQRGYRLGSTVLRPARVLVAA
jgi:molecular chaperone GrpE